MDEAQFWKLKLVQLFHDPPGKPYASYPRLGGHKKVAQAVFEAFSGEKLRYVPLRPDLAAAGADRPMLTTPDRHGPGVRWWTRPYITHPLERGWCLDLRPPADEEISERDRNREIKDEVIDGANEVAAQLGALLGRWQDGNFREQVIGVWRRFRDELTRRSRPDGASGWSPLLQEMPADSRNPDHSLWDHVRVTSALAFLNSTKHPTQVPPPQTPWLLRFSIAGVQRFIEEARTGRDLWLSSLLFSDLIWHAMVPLVERYGPDCILYPDLRANPRADLWLHGRFPEALPAQARNPSSFAAVLPNAFVALVPQGGEGHLEPLEALARQSREAVEARWGQLAGQVRAWLSERGVPGGWEAIWERQQQGVFETRWCAVEWTLPDPIKHPAALRGRSLPGQPASHHAPPAGEEEAFARDRAHDAARRARLMPWVASETWGRYEQAREVFCTVNPRLFGYERGFDYALLHHQLRVRHQLLGMAPATHAAPEEEGEKCTLCGRRQALTPVADAESLAQARSAAKGFWSARALDPEGEGRERLCAVCTTRRFLVEAGSDRRESGESTRWRAGINLLWAGPEWSQQEMADGDGQVRVPFPSTTTLAAQEYLERICRAPQLEPLLGAVVDAYRDAGLPRTAFPRALPRLAALAKAGSRTVQEFLKLETQDALFPEVVEGKRRSAAVPGSGTRDGADEKGWKRLGEAVQALRKAADRLTGAPPGNRIAVIRMDGDGMGRLLLGSSIAARWRDVIHPDLLDQVAEHPQLKAAGWPELLDAPRLMGPSLHAFVSRALGHFSHRVVPWVVEREFSGRLIYAGGDDLLCLAPAGEALALAARLQQLFSAAWVIDTDPLRDPWGWRRPDGGFDHDPAAARRRFAIPLRPDGGGPITLPAEHLARHADPEHGDGAGPAEGEILPMLGSHHSLSAAVVFAHHKTPLGGLLRHAGRLLKEAKSGLGGRALAAAHYSRNGVKSEFILPWSRPGEPPQAHAALNRVIDAFSRGGLPGRLPYKLREAAGALAAAADGARAGQPGPRDASDAAARREKLAGGLFDRACGPVPEPWIGARDAARELWMEGVRQHTRDPHRAVAGLLLCRSLGGGETAEEES